MASSGYCSPTGEHASEDEVGFFGEELNAFSIAWIATAVCVFLSTLMTGHLIYKHLVSFHKPRIQKHVVRILLMVPIYSIDSWLSFRYYWLSVYFDVFRDCYEAIVIYEFYVLLVEYTGGYKRMKAAFEQRAPFKLVVPLCCWKVEPKRGMLRWLSRLTLQYVIVRPMMAIIAIPMQISGIYCPGVISAYDAGYPWVTLIGLISVTVAMYALVLFYVVAKQDLQIYNPVPKFLSIKFIIMMSFWQSVVVSGLVKVKVIHDTGGWTTENIAIGVQNTLICFEMLIVAIWHYFAFNHHEFAHQGPDKTPVWKNLLMCFSVVDVLTDTHRAFFAIKKREEKEPKEMVAKANLVKNAQIDVSDSSTNTFVHPFDGAIVV